MESRNNLFHLMPFQYVQDFCHVVILEKWVEYKDVD